MASGKKELVINANERALSTDINRLQKFTNRDQAEFLRFWLNTITKEETANRIDEVNNTSGAETPASAEVLGGLLVLPENGTLNLGVSAGTLYGIFPDSAADDSVYKYANSPGVVASGATLTITANSSGSIRVDVIECRPLASVTETTSRDIYDNVSGNFVATNITKANENRVEFRVRNGTPGAGYPGNVAGWLPLAVATVPDGTSTNDTVTFWDVRPLLSDRVYVGNVEHQVPILDDSNHAFLHNDDVSISDLYGHFRGIHQGRRVGGILRRGDASASDGDYVDLTTGAHNASLTHSSEGIAYGYLCFPNNLPRWARYTEAAAGTRYPREPKGIFVMSTIACDLYHRAQSAITMPTNTSLGTCDADDAMFIFATKMDATINSYRSFTLKNRTIYLKANFTQIARSDDVEFAYDSPPTQNAIKISQFFLRPGIDFPHNTKSVKLFHQITLPIGGIGSVFANATALNIATTFKFDNCVFVADQPGVSPTTYKSYCSGPRTTDFTRTNFAVTTADRNRIVEQQIDLPIRASGSSTLPVLQDTNNYKCFLQVPSKDWVRHDTGSAVEIGFTDQTEANATYGSQIITCSSWTY